MIKEFTCKREFLYTYEHTNMQTLLRALAFTHMRAWVHVCSTPTSARTMLALLAVLAPGAAAFSAAAGGLSSDRFHRAPPYSGARRACQQNALRCSIGIETTGVCDAAARRYWDGMNRYMHDNSLA